MPQAPVGSPWLSPVCERGRCGRRPDNATPRNTGVGGSDVPARGDPACAAAPPGGESWELQGKTRRQKRFLPLPRGVRLSRVPAMLGGPGGKGGHTAEVSARKLSRPSPSPARDSPQPSRSLLLSAAGSRGEARPRLCLAASSPRSRCGRRDIETPGRSRCFSGETLAVRQLPASASRCPGTARSPRLLPSPPLLRLGRAGTASGGGSPPRGSVFPRPLPDM